MTAIYKQGSRLIVKESFNFKNPRTGRTVTFKKGAEAWVASSQTEQSNNTAEVCRKGQPKGAGYYMTHEDIGKLFHVCT